MKWGGWIVWVSFLFLMSLLSLSFYAGRVQMAHELNDRLTAQEKFKTDMEAIGFKCIGTNDKGQREWVRK